MNDESPVSKPRAVPAGRIVRASRLGGVTAGIGAGAALSGLAKLASGERPDWQELLLTPGNMRRLADELARMRGAAMKVGQLVSMDAGDVLPEELAAIMARLRAEADYMPPKQLRSVLDAAWGPGWRGRFRQFDVRPMAAASIGQVHRAIVPDGQVLAIKIQYPGVRRSIDSDVTNVGALVRMAGLVPKGLDMAPLLEEARRQLHEEADYVREGQQLARFSQLLKQDEDYETPEFYEELSTEGVLAMTYVGGVDIEKMKAADQAERDRIVHLLLALLFREMFEFRLIQTDPNFANYRYDPDTRCVVLLDFGAARSFPDWVTEAYRNLLRAGMDGSEEDLFDASLGLGFFAEDTGQHHKQAVVDMIALAFSALRHKGVFDFGNSDLVIRLRDRAMAMTADRTFLHVPPVETFYFQRKFAGLYLLARTLGARVDVRSLAEPWMR